MISDKEIMILVGSGVAAFAGAILTELLGRRVGIGFKWNYPGAHRYAPRLVFCLGCGVLGLGLGTVIFGTDCVSSTYDKCETPIGKMFLSMLLSAPIIYLGIAGMAMEVPKYANIGKRLWLAAFGLLLLLLGIMSLLFPITFIGGSIVPEDNFWLRVAPAAPFLVAGAISIYYAFKNEEK